MLIGNLTRDPELRKASNGNPVCELGLAINRAWTESDGQKREEVTFLDIAFWGRNAENAAKYLTKGRSVFVEGRLQLDTWRDAQTGQDRSKLKIVGERIQFLGGSGSASSDEAAVPDPDSAATSRAPARPNAPASPQPPPQPTPPPPSQRPRYQRRAA